MTPKTKKISATVGSAVVLASGAYALGAQSDDGSASAKATNAATKDLAGAGNRRGGPGRACDVSALASQLKVDPSKLRQALKEIRADQGADGGPAKQLADALGLPTDKVREALKTLRKEHRGDRRADFAAAVAKSLGVPEAKVLAALDKFGPGRGGPDHDGPGAGRRSDRRAALADAAKELGVSEAKLRSALRDARPDFRPGQHRDGPDDAFAADLAKALNLSTDKVQAAFDKLRKTHDDREAQFAKKLADKLGIPESRVKAALPDGPPGGPRGMRHGGPLRGGPGGPPPARMGGRPPLGPPPGP